MPLECPCFFSSLQSYHLSINVAFLGASGEVVPCPLKLYLVGEHSRTLGGIWLRTVGNLHMTAMNLLYDLEQVSFLPQASFLVEITRSHQD